MKLFYVFDDIEQFIEINKGQSTIGRSSAATFTIRHDTISKVHTLLNYENGILTIEDMGSSNGTFINGVKITKSEVKPTDNIKVGKVSFRVEMSPEELKMYQAAKGNTTDSDITPTDGVESVVDKPGKKSETYFDLGELKNHLPSTAVSTSNSAAGSPSLIKQTMRNRKNFLLIVGSLTVILLMAIVIFGLNKTDKKQIVEPGVTKLPNDPNNPIMKSEKAIKEGIALFLSQPDKAKEKFKEAQGLFPNNNATSSLVQLAEIWHTSEKNWANVKHSEFRKHLDDIRIEDEGQPGAILFNFVNEMTKLEKFEQENENKYAEIITLLSNYKIEDANQKLVEISKESVFFEIAGKKIKQTKFKLIEDLKSNIRNARDTENSQEEVKVINRLIAMLPPNEQKEYIERKEKLQASLNKEKIWIQANEKLDKKEYDEARQLFEMIEQTDAHYYEAIAKITEIKEENARQNIHIMYDVSGEGKAALKIITDSMSTKFNDLYDKIKKVDFLYSEALRKGENNPDDISAHTMLKDIMKLEINPENEYHKRAKKLLEEWTDPEQICKRKLKLAAEKIKLRDYANARLICKEIFDLKNDFDVTSITKQIDKYVGDELNANYRNGRTNEIKKSTLQKLAKIVMIGDSNYDYIQTELLEFDPPK